jgi:HAMP domain-containing protein
MGLLVGGVVAVVAAVVLQPRFTALELSAQRLAPDDPSAQPPQEQVGPYDAFDRRYVVDVTTPDGGLAAIIDGARRQRWRVVTTGTAAGGTAALERGGIAATVSVRDGTTRVTTRVADEVRARQRAGVAGGSLAGLVAGVWWVGWQLRGNPRLRAAGLPRGEPPSGRGH